MSKQVLSIKFKKVNGKLCIATPLMVEQYRLFVSSLKEGDEVESVLELKSKTNTKAQLAKIHICIKEIADEQGETFEEVKKEIKRQCGMVHTENGETKYHSFANCSKEDLSHVIEVIIQIGNFIGINFQGSLE